MTLCSSHTHTHTHTHTTTTTTTSTNKQTNKPLNKPFTSVLHCQKWCCLSICILLAALQMVMLKASQLSRLEPQKVSLITETTDQLWWSVALVGQVREVLQRAAAQWNQESYKASFMNLTPVMKIKVLPGILVLGTYSCQHNLMFTEHKSSLMRHSAQSVKSWNEHIRVISAKIRTNQNTCTPSHTSIVQI